MTTIRSARLAAGSFNTSGSHSIYQAPVGNVVIVKSVLVRNGGGSNMTYWVWGRVNHAGTTFGWFGKPTATPLGAGLADPWAGWWVLEPGDDMGVQLDQNLELDYWVSGTLLAS